MDRIFSLSLAALTVVSFQPVSVDWYGYLLYPTAYAQQQFRTFFDQGEKIRLLEQQNQQLREQLATQSPYAANHLRIIGFATDTRLLIENRGCEKGMAVCHDNVLVGRVERMGHTQAIVHCITDPCVKVPVYIGEVQGIAVGNGAGGISVKHFDRDSWELVPGTPIYTSGKGGYPKGLLVGYVRSIEHQTLQIDYPLPYATVSHVQVVALEAL